MVHVGSYGQHNHSYTISAQPVQGLGIYGNPHIPDFLYLAIMTLTTVSTTVLSAINVKETSVEV